MTGTVFVVHCVDTEGPLRETLGATFERLNMALGTTLAPSKALLASIQAGEVDFGESTDAARRIAAPQHLDYMQDWGRLDTMLDELLSERFRRRFADSNGRGWNFSWFIMDHVGYETNPRHRDIGYHNIFDHYLERLAEPASVHDEMHWHFHPMSLGREAHVCATSFLNSPHLLVGLARRVIDRTWFPNAFRAGFHAERPDSHWFLEQWIPLDFSNQASAEDATDQRQRDIADGRFGDWRRAPDSWTFYHPSNDDYQLPGSCRRAIFRCLNIGTRLRLLTQGEVDRAFDHASRAGTAVLAFCDHDWRDMRRDVVAAHTMIVDAARRFPGVEWVNAGAREAAKTALGWRGASPLRLSLTVRKEPDRCVLDVTASDDTFGPQPFLAVKTWDKRYFSDNFDVQKPFRHWTYVFDSQTMPIQAVESIGVASCGRDASVAVLVCDNEGKITAERAF